MKEILEYATQKRHVSVAFGYIQAIEYSYAFLSQARVSGEPTREYQSTSLMDVLSFEYITCMYRYSKATATVNL